MGLANRLAGHALDVGAQNAKVGELAVGQRAQLRNGAAITLPSGNAGLECFKHEYILSFSFGPDGFPVGLFFL